MGVGYRRLDRKCKHNGRASDAWQEKSCGGGKGSAFHKHDSGNPADIVDLYKTVTNNMITLTETVYPTISTNTSWKYKNSWLITGVFPLLSPSQC